jgi:hypothetical protein
MGTKLSEKTTASVFWAKDIEAGKEKEKEKERRKKGGRLLKRRLNTSGSRH